jgi:hypothetical protein
VYPKQNAVLSTQNYNTSETITTVNTLGFFILASAKDLHLPHLILLAEKCHIGSFNQG